MCTLKKKKKKLQLIKFNRIYSASRESRSCFSYRVSRYLVKTVVKDSIVNLCESNYGVHKIERQCATQIWWDWFPTKITTIIETGS